MSAKSLPLVGVVVTVLAALPGCAGMRHSADPPRALCPARAVVLVVDGAGGFEAAPQAMSEVVVATGLPLRVEPFEWTHGYGRVIADQLDHDHTIMEAKWLAGRIVTLHRHEPGLPIYLVAYSAGSGVALASVEYLPPDSVDRLILLAPAVSAAYDLRPALRASRQGIDVFYSERDRMLLGVGITLFGTTDGRRDSPAAGRVGFRPQGGGPDDQVLYAKLRQHPWNQSLNWTGNRGGHYGCHDPAFLKGYVLPLFSENEPLAAPPPALATVSSKPTEAGTAPPLTRSVR